MQPSTAVAADPRMPVSGPVLLTPWDSLSDLAERIYWYFPVRWLLLDKFDNVSNFGPSTTNLSLYQCNIT